MQSLASLLAVAVAFVSFLSPAHAGVSIIPAREGERCQFPGGAVGRCETMASCLADKGVVKRNGDVVLCEDGNPLKIVSCCRRPHLVAKEMCMVWAPYWLMKTPDRSLTCSTTTPLIHGGEEAVLGEFPHMAVLGKPKNDPTWLCGGSLITPSFVLTAAHCVVNVAEFNPDMVVGLGEHDLASHAGGTIPRLDGGMPDGLESDQQSENSPVEQLIEVAQVYFYPEYQKTYHDIALLKLRRPAVLTHRVLPACLPTQGPERYSSESAFTAAGWGNITPQTPLSTSKEGEKLRKVVIKYVGATKCGHDIKRLLPWAYPRLGITTDMICAGDKGKDTCEGDSGGPLMQKAKLPTDAGPCQPEMIEGVVSFGPKDCASLGVYTRVSSYIDWITGIVAPGVLPPQA